MNHTQMCNIVSDIASNNSYFFSRAANEATHRKQKQDFQSYLQRKGSQYLTDFLKTCDKAAVIFPTSEAVHLATLISEHDENKRFVDLGTEVYLPMYYTYTFYGNIIPVQLIVRYNKVKEAVLWDRWQQSFVQLRKKLLDKRIKPLPPNMSGIILVIFLLYFAGIGFSTACLTADNWEVFSKQMVKL